ncbi:MAG: ABC transporter permease [Bacteroidia bacterium]|nr:ABC transporter permease [Bacteroidia bacterium]MDW8301428.1 FtsX-like permease family protein [Bacteroidia bacterium]
MFARYIAFRTIFQRKRNKSSVILWIGVIGIVVSVCVIQVAISIHSGFKEAITQAIFGYEAQLQIGRYNAQEGISNEPIFFSDSLVQKLKSKHPNIERISHYVLLPSLAQSKTDIEGILIKGVSKENPLEFFRQHLVEGKLPHTDSALQVIIGKTLAQKLQLKLNDKLKLFFLQQNAKARVVKIVGIFQTNMQNIDENTVIASVYLLQKILDWQPAQTMGLEIWLKDKSRLEQDKDRIQNILHHLGILEQEVYTIYQLYPNLFNWIDLQGGHVRIIIALMLIVATMNMTCTLLVLILEQTQTIGILKAMGAKETQIRGIFIYQSAMLIALGSIVGNVLGSIIVFIQQHYRVLKLNPESYFLDYVPMRFSITSLLSIDFGVIVVCTAFMLFPALYSKKISPIKAIRMQ